MEEIRFKWTSNELITKARMEQFTDFLHQRFGYLHILKQGDFGFGLINRQPINHEDLIQSGLIVGDNGCIEAGIP